MRKIKAKYYYLGGGYWVNRANGLIKYWKKDGNQIRLAIAFEDKQPELNLKVSDYPNQITIPSNINKG